MFVIFLLALVGFAIVRFSTQGSAPGGQVFNVVGGGEGGGTGGETTASTGGSNAPLILFLMFLFFMGCAGIWYKYGKSKWVSNVKNWFKKEEKKVEQEEEGLQREGSQRRGSSTED